MDKIKVVIRQQVGEQEEVKTLDMVKIGASYYMAGYGKTDSIEAMLTKIINRRINSVFYVCIYVGRFDMSLVYTSTPDSRLCGYLFSLRHDGAIISTITESQAHYRSATRTIQKQTKLWLKWAQFTFDTKSHIFHPYGVLWAEVTDLASWKAWVWESFLRGGVAHITALDDAWEMQQASLIPLIEQVISEVKHELAKSA